MTIVDLRCEGNTLHGRVTDENTIEVKCKRRRCGHRPGVVVLHTFDIHTGELLSTKLWANPKPQKGEGNAPQHASASVRSA